MFLVTIVCSDPDCSEEREIVVGDLDAVEACACDCSHGFVVLTVSELNEPPRSGSLISLPERPSASRRRAA